LGVRGPKSDNLVCPYQKRTSVFHAARKIKPITKGRQGGGKKMKAGGEDAPSAFNQKNTQYLFTV